MLKLKILFLKIWILTLAAVYAQDDYTAMNDVSTFKLQLEKMASTVQTIESDFIQEKSLSVLSNKIISRGNFLFMKEDNIRWEYTEPYQYLIILSAGRIFIKDETGQQQYDIESNRMFREMNRFITGCIQGAILFEESDYSADYLENESEYFVKLVPGDLALQEMLNSVQISFDRNDLTVTRITMVESGGDYTRIEFINKRLNTDIPLEKFSFN